MSSKARYIQRLKEERSKPLIKAYISGTRSLNFQQGGGFRAAEYGLLEDANPYHHRSKAHAWWRMGHELGTLAISMKLINPRQLHPQ